MQLIHNSSNRDQHGYPANGNSTSDVQNDICSNTCCQQPTHGAEPTNRGNLPTDQIDDDLDRAAPATSPMSIIGLDTCNIAAPCSRCPELMIRLSSLRPRPDESEEKLRQSRGQPTWPPPWHQQPRARPAGGHRPPRTGPSCRGPSPARRSQTGPAASP